MVRWTEVALRVDGEGAGGLVTAMQDAGGADWWRVVDPTFLLVHTPRA